MAQLPLVIQLQQLATDNSTDITELLRKALLVATKLGLQPFRDWVSRELQGYEENAGNLPVYRKLNGTLKIRYRRLTPFIPTSEEIKSQTLEVPLTNGVPIGIPISSLSTFLQSGNCVFSYSADGSLRDEINRNHNQLLDPTKLEDVRVCVNRDYIASIIDAVRTKVLEWSLQLEADGVIGEGMTFSAEEKQRAQSSITIENFQGILGDVSGSVVTQSLQMSVREGDFASLGAYLSEYGVSNEDIEDLEAAIAADPKPASPESFGEKVSAWIGRMVSKASTGAWHVGVGAAGGLLGKALGAYYGF